MGKKNKTRIVAIVIAVIIGITSVYGDALSVAAEETTTIYFVDSTNEGWVGNDSAVIELVDNTQGHDKYEMTKMDEKTWSVVVPTSAYNITFNRYDSTKSCLWNSWSAGGRDGKVTYEAQGTSNGAWTGTVESELEEEIAFQEGDVIYLDLSSFQDWENNDAVFYVNGTSATKEENNNDDVTIAEADKEYYRPSKDVELLDGSLYCYTITKEDVKTGVTKFRFWRGNDTKLWNCSPCISASDYKSGNNCIKVEGWNDEGGSDSCIDR